MLIVVVTTVDVLSANLRGRPITGVFEVVEVALAFVVYLGLGEAFRAEQHIHVDVIDHFIGARAVAFLRALGAVLSVVFLALMGYATTLIAIDAVRFGDVKAETGIPFWAIWAPILLGTALAIASAALVAAKILIGRRPGAGDR